MEPSEIAITKHAWRRFVERYGTRPQCYRAELHRLLEQAQPEDLGYGTAVRLMDNKLRPAQYYSTEGWRFVISDDSSKLITCERPYLKQKKKSKRKKQKV